MRSSDLVLGRSREHTGFTLLETIVVICILSLIASGSMLLLSASLKRAAADGLETRMAAINQWCRSHSRSSTVRLTIDLTHKTIVAAEDGADNLELATSRAPIARLIVGGAVLESGTVQIDYHNGASRSFAVLTDAHTRLEKWLFVCGPTGQVQTYAGSDDVEEAMSKWLTKWSDTD